jgi:hypothetical protein
MIILLQSSCNHLMSILQLSCDHSFLEFLFWECINQTSDDQLIIILQSFYEHLTEEKEQY